MFSFSLYLVASCSSANGLHGEALKCMGDGGTCNDVNATPSRSSSSQLGLGIYHLNDDELTRESAFCSMPTMHISQQADFMEAQGMSNHCGSDIGRRVFSQSCPEPVTRGGSPGTFTDKDLFLFPHIEGSQRKYFDPHWSMDAVDEALMVSLKSGLDV